MVKLKKPLIITGVVLCIAALIIGAVVALRPKSKSKTPPKSKIQEAVNTVPVADRPYVTLSPASEGRHPIGTEIAITVHNVTLGSTKVEYELEYQAGSLLQGAFGSMDFATETPPVTKVLLLGTCSAGGKCDYNKNVTGGTLLLRLSGGSQKFAVKGEWSYQLMSEREGQFSSRDSKFRLDVGASGLPGNTFVIIVQPMGLPKEVEGEVIAGPYHIAAGSGTAPKSTQLEWRLNEDIAGVKLLGWTGTAWKEYKAAVSDKTLTATIDRLTTFVVTTASQ